MTYESPLLPTLASGAVSGLFRPLRQVPLPALRRKVGKNIMLHVTQFVRSVSLALKVDTLVAIAVVTSLVVPSLF